MAIIAGAIGAILTGVSFLNAIVGEAWTRYFILLAGLSANNLLGNFSGVFIIESLISFVIINVFGVQEFGFPVYYGVSSLLILFATMPFIAFVVRISTQR